MGQKWEINLANLGPREETGFHQVDNVKSEVVQLISSLLLSVSVDLKNSLNILNLLWATTGVKK